MSDLQYGRRTEDPLGHPDQSPVERTAATVKDEAREVAHEAASQARAVATDLRDAVSTQARKQNERLAETIRRYSDELREMAEQRRDSGVGAVVVRIADSGRQVADHLERNGPEGVLDDLQEFARRRPGAFLAAALATGFVVGRLGKGIFTVTTENGSAENGSTHAPQRVTARAQVPSERIESPMPPPMSPPMTPATNSPMDPPLGTRP